jgi:hypothetical protein
LSGYAAILCAVLNCLIAGSGTLLAAFLVSSQASKTQIAMGLIMLCTSVLMVGYCLSVYWAYLILQRSSRDKEAIQKYLN